jgi:molybdenum cofactor cytidylyltransferase
VTESRPVAGLVLAAGGSERYGSPKQVAVLEGRPLLEHVVTALVDSALERIVVVLGSNGPRVLVEADLGPAEIVICRDWAEGMSASLKAGIGAVSDAQAALVVLGDQPRLSTASVTRVLDARRPGVDFIRATYGGKPGHPALLESAIFERIHGLQGDRGAGSIAAAVATALVPCDDLGWPGDVDTIEDLRRLERGGSAP